MYDKQTWNLFGWCSLVVIFVGAAIGIYKGATDARTTQLVVGITLSGAVAILLVIKMFGPK